VMGHLPGSLDKGQQQDRSIAVDLLGTPARARQAQWEPPVASLHRPLCQGKGIDGRQEL